MADPARKPAPEADAASAPQSPRLRHLREAEPRDPPHAGGARGLQTRLAHAFTRRTNTALETLLMRLIIIAATCCILADAAGEGGPIARLFR